MEPFLRAVPVAHPGTGIAAHCRAASVEEEPEHDGRSEDEGVGVVEEECGGGDLGRRHGGGDWGVCCRWIIVLLWWLGLEGLLLEWLEIVGRILLWLILL